MTMEGEEDPTEVKTDIIIHAPWQAIGLNLTELTVIITKVGYIYVLHTSYS